MNEVKVKMRFREWYQGLDNITKGEVRAKIIRQCMLEVKDGRCWKFENWLYERSWVERIYQKIINKIAGEQLSYSIDEEQTVASANV